MTQKLITANKTTLSVSLFNHSQLTRTESATTTQDLELKTLKSRINELESFQSTVETECEQLRKDKLLLVDHVSEIQRKVGK